MTTRAACRPGRSTSAGSATISTATRSRELHTSRSRVVTRSRRLSKAAVRTRATPSWSPHSSSCSMLSRGTLTETTTNELCSSTTSSARTPPARGSERSATSRSSTCSAPTRSSSVRFAISGRTIRSGQPLIAGLCALARDAVFRASAGAIFETRSRRRAHERDLAEAVAQRLPGRLQRADAGEDRSEHVLVVGADRSPRAGCQAREDPAPADCTPSTTAYALLLGHLEGVRARRSSTRSGRASSISRGRTCSSSPPLPRSGA